MDNIKVYAKKWSSLVISRVKIIRRVINISAIVPEELYQLVSSRLGGG
jgi:hypothetical protein